MKKEIEEYVSPINMWKFNDENCYNIIKESDTHLQNNYVILKLYTQMNYKGYTNDKKTGKLIPAKKEDNMSFGGHQWFIIPRSNEAFVNEWVIETIKKSNIYKNKDILFDIKDLNDIMKYPLGLKNNSVIDHWKDELGDDKCFASIEHIEERKLTSYEVAEFLRSNKDFMEVKNESK